MRRILICLAVLAAPFPAFAACKGPQGLPLPGAPLPVVPGWFHYDADKGLACVVTRERGAAMAEHKSPVTFLPCLRVGAVGIADSRANVEKVLGEAVAVNEIDVYSETRLYEVAQRGVLRPHYVVTYREDRVVAAQLVGPPMVIPATFSGLTLGDDQQKVVDTLGWPGQRCQMRRDGPELWTWPSFPIAVDMIDGFVAGFKVTWPADK